MIDERSAAPLPSWKAFIVPPRAGTRMPSGVCDFDVSVSALLITRGVRGLYTTQRRGTWATEAVRDTFKFHSLSFSAIHASWIV